MSRRRADGRGRDEAGEADAVRVDLGDLTSRLGFLLRLAQLRVFGIFYRELEKRAVRPGEFSILLVIAENPGIRQGILAEALSIKRAHMTKIVRAMEANGLIERSVPADDRRAVELRLSEAGEARVRTHREAFFALDETAGSPLTASETAQLMRLLRKFLGLQPTA